MNSAVPAIEFLINLVFQLVGFLFLFRLFMRLIGVDYYHPLFQMIHRATSPIVKPLTRVLPSVGQFETATLFILIVLTMLKLLSQAKLGGAPFPHLFGLFLWAIGDLASGVINFFFYLILINALLSWVSNGFNPAMDVISRLCDPLLRPARQFVPTLGGFDISPIVVIAVLMLFNILVVQPYTSFAVRLAF